MADGSCALSRPETAAALTEIGNVAITGPSGARRVPGWRRALHPRSLGFGALPRRLGERTGAVVSLVVLRRAAKDMLCCSARTLRDQPCSTTLRAYQRRVSVSARRSIKATLWYQVNCASGACTIARSGQAAANARLYFRFRGENPFMSGKASPRSRARRSMTFAPQPRRPGDRGRPCRCPSTAGPLRRLLRPRLEAARVQRAPSNSRERRRSPQAVRSVVVRR